MRVLVVAVLACATVLGSVLIGAHTYRTRTRVNDVVIVTGLAKDDFTSDLIVWRGSFARRDAVLRSAYEALARDLETVRKFCAANGLAESEVVFSSVHIEKQFDQVTDQEGRTRQDFKGYLLTETVEVESSDVDRIERFSRKVTDLIEAGVEFYSEPPEYYYTKLGELKLEMIAAATKDGRERAERIVSNAGGVLGPLRYSSLGVFQITAPNSSADFSWSGAFDVTSKRKTASVTIKLQFGLAS